jgi:Kef-type K+ transport system membrane component KefB
MDSIFFQLATVLTLCSLLGLIVLKLRLPLVVGYLIAGVILSAFMPASLHDMPVFKLLPELGIALILFLIGMELDLREIKALGMPIIVGSLSQILISTFAGFAIAGFLGFSQTESLYMGLGLAFSSTIVIIKLLIEKRELSSLYGKLALGMVLLEDLVAILVLMGISVGSSVFATGLQNSMPIVTLILKAIGLFLLAFILSKFVLERVFDAVAKSVELLFLTAVTWCFLFTTLAVWGGFSVVIGAFLAGVALASSPYSLQIEGKVKPLRDFFVTLFFVYLGTEAHVGDFITYWPAILTFTLCALIAKPIFVMLVLGAFGFRKHTFFHTAISLSQISEFSLVVLLVGLTAGIVSPPALSVMAAVAVLSMIVSSLAITYSNKLFRFFNPYIGFFQHGKFTHEMEARAEEEAFDHIIVIGAHRVGGPIVNYLAKTDIPFLVLDFNPKVVAQLRDRGIKVVYGDIDDPEVLESIHFDKAKLIISTAQDHSDNEFLLEEVKRRRIRAKVIVRATDTEQEKELRKMGADYVILPEKVSGDFLVTQLKSNWPNIHFSGMD